MNKVNRLLLAVALPVAAALVAPASGFLLSVAPGLAGINSPALDERGLLLRNRLPSGPLVDSFFCDGVKGVEGVAAAGVGGVPAVLVVMASLSCSSPLKERKKERSLRTVRGVGAMCTGTSSSISS